MTERAASDPDFRALAQRLLTAIGPAILFMDIAIERNGEWVDSFGPDLANLRAAQKAGIEAGLER